jgi:hypothetical protein
MKLEYLAEQENKEIKPQKPQVGDKPHEPRCSQFEM